MYLSRNEECPCYPNSCDYEYCPGSCDMCGEHLEIELLDVYCPACTEKDDDCDVVI